MSGRVRGASGSALLPVVTALAVVAVALVALLGVAAARVPDRTGAAHRQEALTAAREQALGAATNAVPTILSYDYRHLDADFAHAESLLTPRFRKQYIQTTAKAVAPLAVKDRAASTAQVAAAGVVSATPDRVVVLVFVQQTATNTKLTAPRLDRPRVQATLVRVGGRWLVDNLVTV